jgi:hypothetical protein
MTMMIVNHTTNVPDLLGRRLFPEIKMPPITVILTLRISRRRSGNPNKVLESPTDLTTTRRRKQNHGKTIVTVTALGLIRNNIILSSRITNLNLSILLTDPTSQMKITTMDGRLWANLQDRLTRFQRITGTAINVLLMSNNTPMKLKLVLEWSHHKMNLLICHELVKNFGIWI